MSTPFEELCVGDVVYVDVKGSDAWEGERRIPASHLTPVHPVPRALPASSHHHADMDPFLTRDMAPLHGWESYLYGSGVRGTFRAPCSWQFSFGTPDAPLVGKTGGLHMSQNKDGSRRCQLSVEYGMYGDSLVDTIPHTKAGVLMYLPNMGSLSMSFSALLIVYVESVSLVRRAMYKNSSHPLGGRAYPGIEWDYSHVPYTTPWPVFSSSVKSVCLSEFAERRARVWIQAEQAASPDRWKPHIPRTVPHLRPGDTIHVRHEAPGVTRWVRATVKSTNPLVLDVEHAPQSVLFAHNVFFRVTNHNTLC